MQALARTRMDAWTSEWAGVRVHEIMDTGMYGCCDARLWVWMYGCTDIWMHGCMDWWMCGCLEQWMHRCMDGWVRVWMCACMDAGWMHGGAGIMGIVGIIGIMGIVGIIKGILGILGINVKYVQWV